MPFFKHERLTEEFLATANGAKEEDPLSGFGVVGGGKPRVKQEEDLEDTKGIAMATESAPGTQAEPAVADLDMWYAGVSVGADVGEWMDDIQRSFRGRHDCSPRCSIRR